MKLRPLFDRIIVRKLANESANGLVIPERVPANLAVVVACGEGSRFSDGSLLPLKVKPGNKVLLQDGAGSEVEVGLQKFHLIREGDIVGVFEEEEVLRAVK